MSRHIPLLCLGLVMVLTCVSTSWAQEPEESKDPAPTARNLPMLGELFTKKPTQEEKQEVPFLKNIPIVNQFFKREGQEEQQNGLSISPLRIQDSKDEKKKSEPSYQSTFLHRHQCQELLKRFKGIESIEIIETKKTKIGRTGEEITTQSEISVSGSVEDKAKAKQLLDHWQHQEKKLVNLTFYLIDAKAKQSSILPPQDFSVITNDELERLLLEHKSTEGTEILAMPKLTVFHGQRATVSLLNEIAYVKDYEVEVASASVIADPIIDVVREGVVINTSPVINPEGTGITLQVEALVSSVQRPMSEFLVPIQGVGSKVTIQLPEVFMSSKKSDGLVLSENAMAFRVTGLKAIRGKNGDDSVLYELLGTAKIIH